MQSFTDCSDALVSIPLTPLIVAAALMSILESLDFDIRPGQNVPSQKITC